jgi:hypothetical protein
MTDAALMAATGLNGVTLPRIRGSATVFKTEQSRTQLVLELRLAGLPAAARKLVVVALDEAGRRDTRIAPAEIALTGGAEANLEGVMLTLASNAPEGTITTARLLVYVVSGSGKTLGLLQAFTCPHSWLQTPAVLRATPLGELPPREKVDIAFALSKVIQVLESQLAAVKNSGMAPFQIVQVQQQLTQQIVALKIQYQATFTKQGRAVPATRSAPIPREPLPRGLQRALLARVPDPSLPPSIQNDPRFQQALSEIDKMISTTPPENRLVQLMALAANFQAVSTQMGIQMRFQPHLVTEETRWRFMMIAAQYRQKTLLYAPPFATLQQELDRLLERTPEGKRVDALRRWLDGRWPNGDVKTNPETERLRFYNEQLIVSHRIQEVNSELSKLKPVETAKGVPDESKGIGAQGPGTARFEWNDVVEVNFQALSDRSQSLGVAPYIFHDANPASGVYYYLPTRYLLDWQTATGFGFKLFYDQAGAADPVRITLDLRAALNLDDVKIATEVVRAVCAKNKLPFRRLEPYRFSSVSFKLDQALAANLGLNPQKIFVQGYAESGSIRAVIGSSVAAKDLFWNLLTRGGVNGAAVEYVSAADPNVKVQVPVEIKLPDRASFGALTMEKNGLVRNATPFPLTLKYVHVLNFVSGKPTIFTFGLPENELRIGRELTINREQIPDWLSAGALSKTWVEYDIVPSSSAILGAETMATSQALSQSVSEFSLERVGTWPTSVKSVRVQLTSRFLHPTGASEQTKEGVLLTAETIRTLGPVYLRGRQEGVDMGAANPLVRYTLTVNYADGTVKRTPQLTSHYLTIPIGMEQLAQAR